MQPAAGFQPGSRVLAGQAHGGVQVGQVHVVEQDEPGARGQGLAYLGKVVAFDLERHAWSGGAYGPDRLGDPAGGRDVVVFHERGVAEAHAVVPSAAAPYRVLLELAQPWRGLAGVAYRAPGAGHRVGPGPG